MSGTTTSSDSQVATGETESQVDDRQRQDATSDTSSQTSQQTGGSQAQPQSQTIPAIQFDENNPTRPNPHRKGTAAYEIYEARQEAARYRTQARDLENANLSEQQRQTRDLEESRGTVTTLTSRVTELEADNRNLRAQIALAANGAKHPELLASRLSEDDLADEKSAKAAAAALKKEFPELFGASVQGGADGAREGTAPRGSDMNNMFRQVARPTSG
jgi:hypothetical protein